MNDPVRLGQTRPTRMRRIGAEHMIVLPQQQAQVLSIGEVEKALRMARVQQGQLLQQAALAGARVADLERQVEAFRALEIERVEDDPDVPQPTQPHPVPLRPQRLPAVEQLAAPEPERVAADG